MPSNHAVNWPLLRNLFLTKWPFPNGIAFSRSFFVLADAACEEKIEQVIIGISCRGEPGRSKQENFPLYHTMLWGMGGFPTLLSQFENSQILELL